MILLLRSAGERSEQSRGGGAAHEPAAPTVARARLDRSPGRDRAALSHCRRSRCGRRSFVVIGLFALTIGIGSGSAESGGSGLRDRSRCDRARIGCLATRSSIGNLETVVVWGALFAATLRYATPLAFASLGGLFSERSGVVNIGLEGMMLTGAFFAVWGADVTGTGSGPRHRIAAGGPLALLHAFFSITLRADQIVGGHRDQLHRARPHDVPLHPDLRRHRERPRTSRRSRTSPRLPRRIPGSGFLEDVFGRPEPHDLGRDRARRGHLGRRLQDADRPPDPSSRRASAGRRHRRHQRLPIRYGAVILSGMLAAAGGAYLSLGFIGSFNQNMTAGRGFIALAALIFGNWRPFGAAVLPALRLLERARRGAADVLDSPSRRCSRHFPTSLTLVAVAGVIGRSIPPAQLVARTSSSSVRDEPARSGALGLGARGLVSIATLPLAVYLDALQRQYDLLHAGFAIPVAAGLGFRRALARAARASRLESLGSGADRRLARRGASSARSACAWQRGPRRPRRLRASGVRRLPRLSAASLYNPPRRVRHRLQPPRGPPRQDLDFPELEERTKIRPKYLRALEDEQFDILPAPTYVRGFLRSYAEALGLDGQPFVDEYNSRFTVGEDDAPLRARRCPASARDRGPRESRIAVVALVAIADRYRARDRGLALRRAGGRERPGSRRRRSRPATQTRPRRARRLVVRATEGSSWMEVRDGLAAGKLLYSGTLEQGQRKSFEGASAPARAREARERPRAHERQPGRPSRGHDLRRHVAEDRPGLVLSRPRAAIVVTGSELVRGERQDRNGPFLAAEARAARPRARAHHDRRRPRRRLERRSGRRSRRISASSRAGSARPTTTARSSSSRASPDRRSSLDAELEQRDRSGLADDRRAPRTAVRGLRAGRPQAGDASRRAQSRSGSPERRPALVLETGRAASSSCSRARRASSGASGSARSSRRRFAGARAGARRATPRHSVSSGRPSRPSPRRSRLRAARATGSR